MPNPSAKNLSLLFLTALLVGAIAMPTTADARTYRIRVHPNLDAQSGGARAPVVVAQSTDTAAKVAPATPSSEIPPGRVERLEGAASAAATRTESGDPPSERAAAAAARAKRALIEEGGGQFDGGVPAQTDLITTEEPAATNPTVVSKGQAVQVEQTRRTSARLQVPPQRSEQTGVTCVAGCN